MRTQLRMPLNCIDLWNAGCLFGLQDTEFERHGFVVSRLVLWRLVLVLKKQLASPERTGENGDEMQPWRENSACVPSTNSEFPNSLIRSCWKPGVATVTFLSRVTELFWQDGSRKPKTAGEKLSNLHSHKSRNKKNIWYDSTPELNGLCAVGTLEVHNFINTWTVLQILHEFSWEVLQNQQLSHKTVLDQLLTNYYLETFFVRRSHSGTSVFGRGRGEAVHTI